MNLQQLAQQIERQKKLLTVEESLRQQEDRLQEKTQSLLAAWQKEQADVDRLENPGLAALYYELIGKKEERLEKERREALAAAAKYQTAQNELEGIRKEQKRVAGELAVLDGCEERYRQACQERIAELKVTDPEKGAEIERLEEEKAKSSAQLRELREAIHAGEEAQDAAANVKKELDSAEGWGIYDLLGGGLVADLVKHDHLDSARQEIGKLQTCLRSYRTELLDVEIKEDLHIDIDEFLEFADWFFDGLFVDWAVQKKIEEAQERTDRVLDQIMQLQDQLHFLERELQEQSREQQEKIDQLVIMA